MNEAPPESVGASRSPWLRQGVAQRGTTPAGVVTDPPAEPGAEMGDL